MDPTICRVAATKFMIITEREEQVEISFSTTWDVSLLGRKVPLIIDKRYLFSSVNFRIRKMQHWWRSSASLAIIMNIAGTYCSVEFLDFIRTEYLSVLKDGQRWRFLRLELSTSSKKTGTYKRRFIWFYAKFYLAK